MNRFYKTLLLWLLVAVLPLHAVAATMSMFCGPIHQQTMQVAMQDGTPGHHDAGMALHGHEHGSAKMAAATGDCCAAQSSTQDPDNADLPFGTLQHSGCSSCTASCIGAVAPPFVPDITPVSGGSERIAIPSDFLVTGNTPGGLERPPKPILA